MKPTSSIARLAIALALTASTGACVVRGHAWVSTPGVVIVEEEPPPPRREVIVVKAGYVWVDGHWERHGNRWDWRPGYYERARADSDWVPGRWERRGRGHVWIAGTWRVRGGGRGHDNGHHRGDAHDQDHRHR